MIKNVLILVCSNIMVATGASILKSLFVMTS